jgi:hypothetical protein
MAGAYEIEVSRDGGSQVDDHLDKGFNVINQANGGDRGDDNGENESADKD